MSAISDLAELRPVGGISLAVADAGVATRAGADLAVFALAPGTRTAAVFTRNAFCAAPVTVARQHLSQAQPRFLMVNAGNANAGMGERGIADAQACCRVLAAAGACRPEEVLPFSTGVIGQPLPVAAIGAAVPAAFSSLSPHNWGIAARAIMTTDSGPKGASRQLSLGGGAVTVTGIAKGAGMIRPDMATMLAFVATDAAMGQRALEACLRRAVDASFNRISVDGDTSTNDACVLMATGASAGTQIEDPQGDDFERLVQAVTEVCIELARAIVRDGEGATKLIIVRVEGGSAEDCREVAYTVAHSPLVKTAFFGRDPNWGRIMAAVGRAGVAELNPDRVAIYLDEVCIARGGMRAEEYTEARGKQVMERAEIVVRIVLGEGVGSFEAWTCDLSYDYIRINAEYRT